MGINNCWVICRACVLIGGQEDRQKHRSIFSTGKVAPKVVAGIQISGSERVRVIQYRYYALVWATNARLQHNSNVDSNVQFQTIRCNVALYSTIGSMPTARFVLDGYDVGQVAHV